MYKKQCKQLLSILWLLLILLIMSVVPALVQDSIATSVSMSAQLPGQEAPGRNINLTAGEVPQDWTDTGNTAWQIVQVNDRYALQNANPTDIEEAIVWNTPGAATVLEIFGRGETTDNNSSSLELFGMAQPGVGVGYRVDFRPNDNDIRIRFRNADENTLIGTFFFEHTNNQEVCARARFEHIAAEDLVRISVKAWIAGEEEPAEWEVFTDHNEFSTSGYAGVHTYRNTATWYEFGVGIDGASAPTGPLVDIPDVDLSALEVNPGTLHPEFDPDFTEYVVSVGYGIDEISIIATLSDSNATLKIAGESASSGEVSTVSLLPAGEDTEIAIVVTAENGVTEKIYTITVLRAALSVEGLALHLDATTIAGLNDGDPVETWQDLSNNAYDGTQPTSSYRPIYKENVINDKPGVRFDGETQFLTHGDVLDLGTNHATTFIVFRSSRTQAQSQYMISKNRFTNVDYRWGSGVIGGNAFAFFRGYQTDNYVFTGEIAVTDGEPHLLVWELKRDENLRLWIDGDLDITEEVSAWQDHDIQSSLQFRTGSSTAGNSIDISHAFKGDIAEVIIYFRVLSEDERQQVEQYLGKKWLGWE